MKKIIGCNHELWCVTRFHLARPLNIYSSEIKKITDFLMIIFKYKNNLDVPDYKIMKCQI